MNPAGATSTWRWFVRTRSSYQLKRALVARLRHETLPCPARGLELVLYRRSVAQAGTLEPGFEVELNTGAGMSFRATYAAEDRPVADGRFWYALDRSILHQSGYVIFGPPASEMFADLSPTDIRTLLVDAFGGGSPCPRRRVMSRPRGRRTQS